MFYRECKDQIKNYVPNFGLFLYIQAISFYLCVDYILDIYNNLKITTVNLLLTVMWCMVYPDFIHIYKVFRILSWELREVI